MKLYALVFPMGNDLEVTSLVTADREMLERQLRELGMVADEHGYWSAEDGFTRPQASMNHLIKDGHWYDTGSTYICLIREIALHVPFAQVDND